MGLNVVLVASVMCAVTITAKSGVDCEYTRRMQEYSRVKRAKYYSNPPMRFYKLPPMPHQINGPFSVTPPPKILMENGHQYPGSYRPSKFSKRPVNDGLGDEDINNIVRYLSKSDLDKIIEFAGEKERYRADSNENNFQYSKPPAYFEQDFRYPSRGRYVRNNPEERPKVEHNPNKDIDDEHKFSLDGPYIRNPNERPLKVEQNKPKMEYITEAMRPQQEIEQKLSYNGPYLYQNQDERPFQFDVNSPNPNTNYVKDTLQANILYTYAQDPDSTKVAAYSNTPLKEQAENEYFNDKIKETASQGGNIFTDSSVMKEEMLPTPVNLRQEDNYEVSYTNKVPAVVKAASNSYEVASFGDLPLMNYQNSKLYSVSSYHVPHYTVTSPAPRRAPPSHPSSSSGPTIERAPPDADGKDQSDAHLKAIRIWTHRSKGTSYTLHKDGTLSLEVPKRPKHYGHQ